MEESEIFIAYEYKEEMVRNEKVQIFKEAVYNFGWEIVEKKRGFFKTKVKLRRNVKLRNNHKLKAVEKQLEIAFNEIDRLETTYKDNATLLAIFMGILGAAFMAGSFFNFDAANYLWMVILAIPGCLLWFTTYPVYRFLVHGKKKKSDQLISQYYQMIYETAEKAFHLEK